MSRAMHFLGWERPVTEGVAAFLLPESAARPFDLSGCLLVVPTQQAGRRLRRALALHCREQGGGLLAPRVVTPAQFLQGPRSTPVVANESESADAWQRLLRTLQLQSYRKLFPIDPPVRDIAWGLKTGRMLQELRRQLAEGGCRLGEVPDRLDGCLPDPLRWRDMARVEAAYLDALKAARLQDPCEAEIAFAEQPLLPGEVTRVVVAAVPDPTLLFVRALTKLPEEVQVDVVVHAPASLAEQFDEWGRPRPAYWSEAVLNLPDEALHLEESPRAQADAVVRHLAGLAEDGGPPSVAIGVPDPDVAPYLATALEAEALATNDPSGCKVSAHPLYRLLRILLELAESGRYEAVSSLLRQSDVLRYLHQERALSSARLLTQLDTFQNERLPSRLEDMESCFRSGEPGGEYDQLNTALQWVRSQVTRLENAPPNESVPALLAEVYAGRSLSESRPEDETFLAVARTVNRLLDEGTRVFAQAPPLEALHLLLFRLEREVVYPRSEETHIDLEGWLELSWNDAEVLVLTGMNEGAVPSSRMEDVFLPDSVRAALSLRDDSSRYARDVYLLASLAASRPGPGRLHLWLGKTSASGDPLKPSRLLFHGAPGDLPARAMRLFGPPAGGASAVPASLSFQLRPERARHAAHLVPVERMSVTLFREYLACPFRFFLGQVLGMAPLDDTKRELDAMDFGRLLHYALQRMAGDDAMRACDDPNVLGDFLCTEAEGWLRARVGAHPPLPVAIQLDAARQRLEAAAREEIRLRAEGWETVACEQKVEAELSGMTVRGVVDRVDRHRESGVVRLLDYKTSDRPSPPAKTHLSGASQAADFARVTVGGKEKAWTDLQLPLYEWLCREAGVAGHRVEVGYFNLPKAVNETRVELWDEYDERLYASGLACAEAVVAAIQSWAFWPPSAPQYDAFETLFPGAPEELVDGPAFEAWLGRMAAGEGV